MKEKLKQKKYQLITATSSAMATMYVMMAQAHAYTPKTGLNFTDLQSNLLDLIFNVLRVVGVALAAMGIYKVAISFKDDRPEDMKQGVATILAGVVLIAAPSVLSTLGVLSAT